MEYEDAPPPGECLHGHAMDDTNATVKQVCRRCAAAWSQKAYLKRKLAKAEAAKPALRDAMNAPPAALLEHIEAEAGRWSP